mgnify:CR=1 FL=1
MPAEKVPKAHKECPLCSELMTRRERDTVVRVAGTGQTTPIKFSEWVCPECDYFEEAEDESD